MSTEENDRRTSSEADANSVEGGGTQSSQSGPGEDEDRAGTKIDIRSSDVTARTDESAYPDRIRDGSK